MHYKIMVFFTCNACGQSVKKNQVESHFSFQCRNCESVSCMDCNKEFWGNEYKEHTKCISENEKYGGKDYKPKLSFNKGEIKQEKWIEHIKSTMETKKISGPLSGLLGQIISYSNIPRKKSKFENFLKNSLKIWNPNLISEAWDIFAESTKNDSDATKNQNSTSNGVKAVDGSSFGNGTNSNNPSLKRVADDQKTTPSKKTCIDSPLTTKGNNSRTFDWCRACESILQNSPSSIPEKKLRKKVIAEYKAHVGNSNFYSDDELKTLFRNELLNSPIFSVSVDSSKLSET